MAADDLINFDVIEGQKENIQSLPGGRSARKLAEIYSPSPLQNLSTPTPTDSRNVNDCIRREYEQEIQNISESDDPLDVFDRYVRWTLDAYPSAQATPQSQLHTVLERATKAFVNAAQYKNDPRYVKMWIHYIHFFTDSPRETYIFMSRHSIGESLALFYEEYAAWLEGAGRWTQAEEVFKMGIEREARPVQRLVRKFKEFEERLAQQPDGANEPLSPALPTIRPALAAKTDPFGVAAAAAAEASDPQARRANASSSGAAAKPGKAKMAIFSDNETKPSALGSKETGSKGWDTIGSMADRKKENTVEAKPWVGETLKAGGKKPAAAAKMSIFRDPSLSQISNIVVVPSKNQVTLHPQTGKKERIFVDLAALYPTPEEQGTELSFEEVMAANRGWLDHSWKEDRVDTSFVPEPVEPLREIEEISKGIGERLVIHQDRVLLDENGAPIIDKPKQPRAGKKKKGMEVNETQIIKAKLDSPSGPKMKKRNQAEPTMTIHTRAATDDIYDIFNAPLKTQGEEEDNAVEDDDSETDGDYTTDAESTGTTRQIDATSEAGDDETSDVKSVSEWSEFSTRRHVPDIGEEDEEEDEKEDEEEQQNVTQASNLIEGSFYEEEDQQHDPSATRDEDQDELEDDEPSTRTVFVPVKPEDWSPPTRPFRDPVEMANNRLPFMTPITERTEASLDVETGRRLEQFKTPSKRDENSFPEEAEEPSDLEPMSSPLREIISAEPSIPRVPTALARKPLSSKTPIPPKGPIIKDIQCNPVDESIRNDILINAQPPLSSYTGFYDHRHENYEHGGEIRKFAKILQKNNKPGAEKTASLPIPVALDLPGVSTTYTINRQLGAGAFAPVYLVASSAPEEAENDENAATAMGKGTFAINHRKEFEALKMEAPPTPWEFHMMRVSHARLGPQHRAAASLSYAHEMHLYQDEAFLFLPYHPHGTLLDVINLFRAEPCAVMDEQLAMLFTIELLRTVEALHARHILHGDLKPDNCLLRLDKLSNERLRKEEPLTSQWHADGSGGWDSRGVVLIDFGRTIDMRAFVPEVEFIADWKTTAQDCAEMREGRPWTWQIDYHGLAGIIHCLLFGKYIETVRSDQGGLGRGGRKYRIRESLKRYWQTDLWNECFEMLLNPTSFLDNEEGRNMPVLKTMKGVRESMESWLENNCERGVGLKNLMGKVENYAKSRKF